MEISPADLLPLFANGTIQKINVIGTSGSGKSTLARALAKRLQFPYVEMDQLFWEKNWQQKADPLFFRDVERALARANWVLDGNYSRTIPLKWQNVDLVIWLDYSFSRTLYQALKRAIHRAYTQVELWEGTGNKESFRRTFLQKESIVWWTITTHQKVRLRNQEILRSPKFAHLRFLRLASPAQTQEFFQNIPCATESSFAR
jgi:adenylate kinase family enzyme